MKPFAQKCQELVDAARHGRGVPPSVLHTAECIVDGSVQFHRLSADQTDRVAAAHRYFCEKKG